MKKIRFITIRITHIYRISVIESLILKLNFDSLHDTYTMEWLNQHFPNVREVNVDYTMKRYEFPDVCEWRYLYQTLNSAQPDCAESDEKRRAWEETS